MSKSNNGNVTKLDKLKKIMEKTRQTIENIEMNTKETDNTNEIQKSPKKPDNSPRFRKRAFRQFMHDIVLKINKNEYQSEITIKPKVVTHIETVLHKKIAQKIFRSGIISRVRNCKNLRGNDFEIVDFFECKNNTKYSKILETIDVKRKKIKQ